MSDRTVFSSPRRVTTPRTRPGNSEAFHGLPRVSTGRRCPCHRERWQQTHRGRPWRYWNCHFQIQSVEFSHTQDASEGGSSFSTYAVSDPIVRTHGSCVPLELAGVGEDSRGSWPFYLLRPTDLEGCISIIFGHGSWLTVARFILPSFSP